jgi:hypothetical protein
MSPKKDTRKSAKRATAINRKFKGLTDEERAAMKERIQELKADKADGESAVLAKIAEMRGSERVMAPAAPCDHRSHRARPVAENLVRHARVCQERQGRLLPPKCAEVQIEGRDVRLQRRGEPRRRGHVTHCLRAEGVGRCRRGEDRRAREEGGELRTEFATGAEVTNAGASLSCFRRWQRAQTYSPRRDRCSSPSPTGCSAA